MEIQTEKDERQIIILNCDDWIAVEQISRILHKIPGICQKNRKLLICEDEKSIRPISNGKLRHYIGVICQLIDDRGKGVHPTGRLISGVRSHGIYPGVRSIS